MNKILVRKLMSFALGTESCFLNNAIDFIWPAQVRGRGGDA